MIDFRYNMKDRVRVRIRSGEQGVEHDGEIVARMAIQRHGGEMRYSYDVLREGDWAPCRVEESDILEKI